MITLCLTVMFGLVAIKRTVAMVARLRQHLRMRLSR